MFLFFYQKNIINKQINQISASLRPKGAKVLEERHIIELYIAVIRVKC